MRILLLTLPFILTTIFSFAQSNLSSKAKYDFEQKYGEIYSVQAPNGRVFHRVITHPIMLASTIHSKEHLKRLIELFIDDNQAFFGFSTANLKLKAVEKPDKVWYLHYAQSINDIEVLESEVTFRVHENGNLFLFGVDYFHDVLIKENASNNVDYEYLEAQVSKNIASTYERIVLINEETFYYPLHDLERTTLVKTLIFEGWKKGDKRNLLVVDVETGDLIQEISKTHHNTIKGTVTGEILPRVATEQEVEMQFPHLFVKANDEQFATNKAGEFEIPASTGTTPLEFKLKGKYLNVINFNRPDAKINIESECDTSLHIIFDNSNSTLAERNVYHHINFMHDLNKEVDSSFTALDYPLNCIVNDNSAFCNAYWDGNRLVFNTQDNNCSINSAYGASIIYHEYGHAINDHLYRTMGSPLGMRNPTLQEAFSDIYSTLLVNDSRFALGWFGPGTMTRNVRNTNRFPDNLVGQQHTDGLILGGTFWDLGSIIGNMEAYRLAHFAKYGIPDDADLEVAFAEIYLETLIADDDDGNLMNGTPNNEKIEAAFCKHGIGSDLFTINRLIHIPAENISSDHDYTTIKINTLDAPDFIESAQKINLVYSIDNFDSSTELMMEQVDTSTFEVDLPIETHLIKYYFKIENNICGRQLLYPSKDFKHESFSLVADYLELIFEDDFETDKGWQLSTTNDNATAGRWNRAIPQEVIDGVGFLLTPDKGHGDGGRKCLVTGAARGTFWYSSDVDGGKTSVVSPVFSNLTPHSVFSFYKWFVHGAAFTFPAQGRWNLEITNDGRTWQTIEDTQFGNHRYWIKSAYQFSDFVEITDRIQVRCVVSDFGAGSIVEGLIDDFQIYNSPSLSTASIPKHLVKIYPNPSQNFITIQLDQLYKNIEVSLYNSIGQKVNSQLFKQQDQLVLNVEGLKTGVYMLKLLVDDQWIFSDAIMKL